MFTQIPPEAVESLRRGAKIEAIKQTRLKTGLGLKEAKDAVEAYLAGHPGVTTQYQATAEGHRVGLGWVAIAALFVAAIAAYFWLR